MSGTPEDVCNTVHEKDYKSIGMRPWANAMARIFWCIVLSIYNRLRVIGRDNFPHGPVITAPNHNSHLDPSVVSGSTWFRTVAYLGKDGLFRVPVFNTFIWRLGCIPVHQNSPDHQAIKLSVQMLQRGYSLCVFPEGHRSPDGEMLPLHKGVALIAKMSGVPVIPAAIWGTRKALAPGSFIYLPAKVSIMYGKPVTYEQFVSSYTDGGDALQAFTDFLEHNIRQQLKHLQGNETQQDAVVTSK